MHTHASVAGSALHGRAPLRAPSSMNPRGFWRPPPTQATSTPGPGQRQPQTSLHKLVASTIPTGLARWRRDLVAGAITGLVGLPLTIGICMMSEFPVQSGLITAIIACVTSYLFSLHRPGNHVGVPDIAAGLAPVLAMGVHHFGMARMPWVILVAALMQAVVWRTRLEGAILRLVPPYLVEGLLAGVGLKIALKFLPDTLGMPSGTWDSAALRPGVALLSAVTLATFLWLTARLHGRSPGLPSLALLVGGVVAARVTDPAAPLPMLQLADPTLTLRLPWEGIGALTPQMHFEIIGFAAMLALIDVIEQVMSNAAIERLDPYQRPSDSNASLLTMWVGNALASFFGGMTNLDGLAKSSTNAMAGAVSKASNLAVAMVFLAALAAPEALRALPRFALAVLMIYTGARMVAGLVHVADHGRYPLLVALFCGVLVWRLGLFEGLLLTLALHACIVYAVARAEHVPGLQLLRQLAQRLAGDPMGRLGPGLEVHVDPVGGAVFRSVPRNPAHHKSLDAFIEGDWSHGINTRNILNIIGCYDARGLLWGTFARELRTGHAAIKGYFEHLFDKEALHVEFQHGEVRQYGDIYIKSGAYEFSYLHRGRRVAVPARYSFVCKRESSGWTILEHHSSEFPS